MSGQNLARRGREADPFAGDPFFRRHANSDWNACIGPQGAEEHYVDGYIEAAIELSEAIIDKKQLIKRDTLVLPILYNARHSLELALKFVMRPLVEAKLVERVARHNHDIKAYWERLDKAKLGDHKLMRTIAALKPFIDSLDRIDRNGQGLRYHVNSNNAPSLPGHPLANLEVIRDSLRELAPLIEVLKNRVLCFVDERATGTFTEHCSRHDLLEIAQRIPRRDQWRSALFDEQKRNVKAHFVIGSKAFSEALNVIQKNRQTKALIGVESNLLYLSDDDIAWLSGQWRRLHPPRDKPDAEIIDFSQATVEDMLEGLETRNAVIEEVAQGLSADQLADLQAIYYIGRDRIFPEYYESKVEQTKRIHAVRGNPVGTIVHLMDKTNLFSAVLQAVESLGRLALAGRLRAS